MGFIVKTFLSIVGIFRRIYQGRVDIGKYESGGSPGSI